MSHFGRNIKRIREERRMTQQELAVKARIGTNTLVKYEEGEKIPDTPTVLKFSTVLDVPASALLDERSPAS
ncbi:helix-turn-helix transcriptional regulator [Rossellomorea sp. RS05]|uniref:helix-turn-helix domain-containing protein n=1 Tax=Rossellomorea sp. RS05 TaxID=3149166 RepID=UPI001C45AFF1|nr:helix-turn-helix domain-containing protein [Bacillus sp. JRC01]